jgi:hypothetical protein
MDKKKTFNKKLMIDKLKATGWTGRQVNELIAERWPNEMNGKTVAEIAEAYPTVTIMAEWCDEYVAPEPDPKPEPEPVKQKRKYTKRILGKCQVCGENVSAMDYILELNKCKACTERDIIEALKAQGPAMLKAGDEGEFIDQLKVEHIKIEDYLTPEELKKATHLRICQELTDTYIKKNHDYGDSFADTFRTLGIISAVTRITDKTNRLASLCTKKQRVNDESILDTLMDLANYSILTVMELRKGGNA